MPRRKKTSPLEDMIDLVSMLPWWLGVALAPASYFLMHAWAVRVAADMATGPQVTLGLYYALASAGQVLLPFVCLAGAAMSAWRRHCRKELADSVAAAKAPDILGEMSWREFEILVGEGFRRKGYQVEELGGGGADGGVDLVLSKAGEKHLVQCKQWRAYRVGVEVVRELHGVMAAEGAAGGFVVTSGRFTDEARAFAEGRNVRLLDGEALFTLIRSARGVERERADASSRPEVRVRRHLGIDLAASNLFDMRGRYGAQNRQERCPRGKLILGMRCISEMQGNGLKNLLIPVPHLLDLQ